MGSAVIVIAQPGIECPASLLRSFIRTLISPAKKQRLDETLGFSVGLGVVRASANMANVTAIQSATETARYVSGTVVGHDSLDATDSLGCEEALSAFEKADRGYAFL